jgi:hypothetical protein
VRVKGLGNDEVHTLRTVNLSRTGVLLRTNRRVSVGTLVELTFAESGSEDVVVSGKVVRVVTDENAAPGIGVAFMNAHHATLDRLKTMIRSPVLAERGSHAAPAGSKGADASYPPATVLAASVAMDPRTALNRAMRLRATDRAEHALEIAEALVQCFPDREDFQIFHHLTRAALLQANGERNRALTLWEDVLRLDPNNDEARTAIGGGMSTATQRSGLSKFLGRFRGG